MLKPLNPKQKDLIASINSKVITVALGSAGTGKSYVTSVLAGEKLKNKEVRKIIITRPTIPVSTSIGFFPGTLDEKMAPWVIPIMSTLIETLGKGFVECALKNGNIEIVPFETIRGRSFENCFVILDEAQNCTVDEMKAFVTRIGEYSSCAVTGDLTQSDLKGDNGLLDLLHRVERTEELARYVGVVKFTPEDIVRSGMCKLLVMSYEGII